MDEWIRLLIPRLSLFKSFLLIQSLVCQYYLELVLLQMLLLLLVLVLLLLLVLKNHGHDVHLKAQEFHVQNGSTKRQQKSAKEHRKKA